MNVLGFGARGTRPGVEVVGGSGVVETEAGGVAKEEDPA